MINLKQFIKYSTEENENYDHKDSFKDKEKVFEGGVAAPLAVLELLALTVTTALGYQSEQLVDERDYDYVAQSFVFITLLFH
jgi:hypothetical protein